MIIADHLLAILSNEFELKFAPGFFLTGDDFVNFLLLFFDVVGVENLAEIEYELTSLFW